MKTVHLSLFDNSWYNPGRGFAIRLLWYYVNLFLFKNPYIPVNGLKTKMLRLFGAKIGKGVVIKPSVNIKYPWNLRVGNHVWIGEGVWIDNLATVTIADDVCISQGAMLLCGNHNYKKESFDLVIGEINLDAGCWVGAQATVCPKVTLHSHSILTVGSVATADLKPYTIYQGNPAKIVRERIITAL